MSPKTTDHSPQRATAKSASADASELPTLDASLPRRQLDPDAVSVVRDLQADGHVTYFVGGCVRDLLLGRQPKDTDIATLATPPELKRRFRNCRIIGRRFRLAHLYFGPKVIEVATFRGRGAEAVLDSHDEVESVIERTNTFGTPDQDARSRDFTINALFYDPVGDQLIDYVNGYPDIEKRVIRTIGAPMARLTEDPVRILRAVKFASRLDFDIEPETFAAMKECAPLIAQCPAPRVTEEIFRIAESGYAQRAFEIMAETGVLDVILPEIGAFAESDTVVRGRGAAALYADQLELLDRMVAAHDGVPREFVLTMLYYPMAIARVDQANEDGPAEGESRGSGPRARSRDGSLRDWGSFTDEWHREVGIRMHVPVRMRARLQRLMSTMQRMQEEHKRPRRSRAFVRQDGFSQALELLRAHIVLFAESGEPYERWASLAKAQGVFSAPFVLTRASTPPSDPKESSEDRPAPRRRRRRRRSQ